MHIRRTVTGCGGPLFVAREAPCGFEKSFRVSFLQAKNDVLYDFRQKSLKVSFSISKNDISYDFPGPAKVTESVTERRLW